MNRLTKGIVTGLLLASSSLALAAQGLTDEAVRALVARIDQAAAAKDFNAMGTALSDDVQIDAMVTVGGKSTKEHLGKAEYLARAKAGLSTAQNYTWHREDQQVIIDGNVAKVTSVVVEGAALRNQYVRAKTHEKLIVELVKGVPMVTRVTSFTNM